MSTALSSRAALTGSISFERNEAVLVPVPGIPGSNRVVLVTELLDRIAELSKRVVTLETEHARNVATASADIRRRRKMARAQSRHPLDRTDNAHDDGVLQTDGEEDLLTLHNESFESELVDAALAEQGADRACQTGD